MNNQIPSWELFHLIWDNLPPGQDIYRVVASVLLDKPIEEVTNKERFWYKTRCFHLLYSTGSYVFEPDSLKAMRKEEALKLYEKYRSTYPGLFKN